MEIEYQKLLKLQNMEKRLAALLQKIDNEIIQTDVEWMHLRSIAEAQRNSPAEAENISKADKKQVQTTSKVLLKSEHNIDSQAINNMELDLSLGAENSSQNELELDSD